MIRAVFIGEGASDTPLADIVATLFRQAGVDVDVTRPDFDRLPQPRRKDVASKAAAALQLTTSPIDLFVVHRDADRSDSRCRRAEIKDAILREAPNSLYLPVIPIQMTEAWLLLDEQAIRAVSGDPRGRMPLDLPSFQEIERRSDAKTILAEAILTASATSGRRRQKIASRFGEHRRRLLERLDLHGPVTRLQAWQELINEVSAIVKILA